MSGCFEGRAEPEEVDAHKAGGVVRCDSLKDLEKIIRGTATVVDEEHAICASTERDGRLFNGLDQLADMDDGHRRQCSW